jgi:hypothetical protein
LFLMWNKDIFFLGIIAKTIFGFPLAFVKR